MTEPYRGERIGLPEQGRGSLAGFGRRLAALFVDWAAANLVTLLFTHGSPAYGSPDYSWLVLGVFAVEVWLLTWTTGSSFGQRLLGLRVVSLRGGRVGPGRALFRTVLICLAVPPLIVDSDGRGMHDRGGNTAVVRV